MTEHNHLTREIRRDKSCPKCDEYLGKFDMVDSYTEEEFYEAWENGIPVEVGKDE